MVQTTIQINGLKEVRAMLKALPKNLRVEIGDKALKALGKNLQKRMKNRIKPSSRYSTGWLRRSIMVEKHGKMVKVVVHAYYGAAVEKGSTPHPIPIGYLEQHETIPEAPGQFITRGVRAYVWVGGKDSARPFVAPALASFRPAVPNILKRFLKKALGKSKK